MRPVCGCPKNFRESPSTPTATFAKSFNGLLFRSILWMCVQNLKFVALPILEIIGGTQKIGQSLDTPPLFSQNFNGLVRMDPVRLWSVDVPAKFEVRCFSHSWDSKLKFWGLQTPNFGKKEAAGGRGWYRSKQRCFISYRLSIVTFPLSLHVSEIAAFVLQHATFPHPISSLPKISPCSPGSRWMVFGLLRAKEMG